MESKSRRTAWRTMGLIAALCVAGGQTALAQQLSDLLKSDVRTLSDDLGDANCTEPVDPFKLESNFGRLMSDAAGQFGKKLLTNGLSPNVQAAALDQARQTAKGLNWLPIALEERLGDMKHQQLQDSNDPTYTMLERSDDSDQWAVGDAVFAKILATLPPDQPYKFKLIITNRQAAGAAFALPGGYIYVPAGSVPVPMDKANFERKKLLFTFLLAHEIAHVLKRHETRQLQAELLDSMTKIGQLRDLVNLLDSANGSVVDALDSAAVKKQLNLLKKTGVDYSVPQEKQADGCSLRAMLVAKEPAELGFNAFVEMLKVEADEAAKAAEAAGGPPDGRGTPAAPHDEDHGGLGGFLSNGVGGLVGSTGGAVMSLFDSSSNSPQRPGPPPNGSAHPDYPDRTQNGRRILAFWKAHNPAPLQTYQPPTKAP